MTREKWTGAAILGVAIALVIFRIDFGESKNSFVPSSVSTSPLKPLAQELSAPRSRENERISGQSSQGSESRSTENTPSNKKFIVTSRVDPVPKALMKEEIKKNPHRLQRSYVQMAQTLLGQFNLAREDSDFMASWTNELMNCVEELDSTPSVRALCLFYLGESQSFFQKFQQTRPDRVQIRISEFLRLQPVELKNLAGLAT